MEKKFDILTFGSITLDLFLCPREIGTHRNFFHFPIGDKIRVAKILKFAGGGAANSAVGFSKLNLRTAIFGVLGDDDDSHFIEKILREKKIETKFLLREKNSSSSFSAILLAPSGGRTVFHHRNIAVHFSEKNLRDAPPTRAIYVGHLYDESEKMLFEIPNWQKNSEKKFFWNPGKTQFSGGFSKFKKIFPCVDAIFLNVEEAENFTGIEAEKMLESRRDNLNLFPTEKNFLGEKIWRPSEFPAEYFCDVRKIAQKFLNAGVKKIFITDGRRGAQFFDQNKNHFFVPALDEPAKNTLGAGDAFSVGAVAAILHDEKIEHQILWAAKNASSVVREVGAQNGQLFFDEISKN